MNVLVSSALQQFRTSIGRPMFRFCVIAQTIIFGLLLGMMYMERSDMDFTLYAVFSSLATNRYSLDDPFSRSDRVSVCRLIYTVEKRTRPDELHGISCLYFMRDSLSVRAAAFIHTKYFLCILTHVGSEDHPLRCVGRDVGPGDALCRRFACTYSKLRPFLASHVRTN